MAHKLLNYRRRRRVGHLFGDLRRNENLIEQLGQNVLAVNANQDIQRRIVRYDECQGFTGPRIRSNVSRSESRSSRP